jgi:hypothetical protein
LEEPIWHLHYLKNEKERRKSLIPDEIITNKIYLIHNQKAMLDSHLAELYQVETKIL